MEFDLKLLCEGNYKEEAKDNNSSWVVVVVLSFRSNTTSTPISWNKMEDIKK